MSESDSRAELFSALQALAEIVPEMRGGQLMAAVGELCADLHGRGLWDTADAELLEAIWQFRRNFEATTTPRNRHEKENLVLEKWKRAVIHLECATDSEYFYDRIKRIDQQRSLLEEGKITREQFVDEVAGRSRDIRSHGTALFLSHAGRRYLLTARHVVWDERSAKREWEEEVQRSLSWPAHTQQDLLQSAQERAQNKIFSIIFRVPSFDDVPAKRKNPEFLMNLGAGTSSTLPYTFSDPGLDLALISLDQPNRPLSSQFADELNTLGHVPVASEDIADTPNAEGQEVFTIGFPSSTALIGQVIQHPASAHWSSSYFSLPVSTFGRISMLHEALPFFWADMSIYPGNSGGPVVANDRLVGVVSGQAILPIDGTPDVRIRIPFGRISKTKFVRELLEMQARKDLPPSLTHPPRGRTPLSTEKGKEKKENGGSGLS